jgi:hypothetical protein
MRIGILLASLALATAQASMAIAAGGPSKPTVSGKTGLPTNLRGSIAPDAPPAPKSIVLTPVTPNPISVAPRPLGSLLATSLASSSASAKLDEGQCRSGCAHTYYFCLSGVQTNDCAPTWSQCLSRCSHPPLSIDR